MTESWWRRARWNLYAPVYDLAAKPMESGRRRAIERLDPQPDDRILLLGCGTGLDLESLPSGAAITAVDRSPAMLERTRRRAERLGLDVEIQRGDAESLEFADESFDAVCLHLILSVVADPEAVVRETARVLDADGRVSVFDKFLPPEATAPPLWRRLADPIASVLFSKLNRRLEPMVVGSGLLIAEREPILGPLYTVAILRPDRTARGASDRSV